MALDPSKDYARYPTLAPLPAGTPSPHGYICCPLCSGTAFRLRRMDRVPVCMGCEYVLEAEDILPQLPEDPEQTQTEDFSFTPNAAPPFKLQIVRGPDHTVVLRPDGTVKAVGNNKYGQCNVQDWKSITAVATNRYYTVGLCKNGAVRVATTPSSFLFRNKLSSWKNITDIATGDNFVVARCADGTVKSIGIRLPVWSGITAIAAAGFHVAALCEDGSVRAIGSASHGMCKVQDWTRIKAIALGSEHTVGLCEDGTVKAVGFNKKSKQETTPRCEVGKWTRITAIAAGNAHTVGLHEDGWVFAVGSNANGQCDVSEWSQVVAICAGETFTAGLRADGTILCTDPTVRKLLEEIHT